MFTKKLNPILSCIVICSVLLAACSSITNSQTTPTEMPYPEVISLMTNTQTDETVQSGDSRFPLIMTAVAGGLSTEQKSIIMANGFKLKPLTYNLLVDGIELDPTVWKMIKGSLNTGDNYVVMVRFIRDEANLITGAEYLKIPSSLKGSSRLTRGFNGLIAGLKQAAINEPEAAGVINELIAQTKLVPVTFGDVTYNGLLMPHYGPTLDWLKWSGNMTDVQISGYVDQAFALAGRLFAQDATTVIPGFVSTNAGKVGIMFADPNLGNIVLIRFQDRYVVALIDFDNSKFFAQANEDTLSLLWSYFQKTRANQGLPLSNKSALEALPEDLRAAFSAPASQLTAITDETGTVVAQLTRSPSSLAITPVESHVGTIPTVIIDRPASATATRLTLWEMAEVPVRQTLVFLNYASWVGMLVWADSAIHESFVKGDLKTYEVFLESPMQVLGDQTGPGINLDVVFDHAYGNKKAIIDGNNSLQIYFPKEMAAMLPVAASLRDYGADPNQIMEATLGQFRDQLFGYSSLGSLRLNVNGSGFFDHQAPILLDGSITNGHRRVTFLSVTLVNETLLPQAYAVCDQNEDGTWACQIPVADFNLPLLNADQQAGNSQHFAILGLDNTNHYLQIVKVP